jgi:hypothetical protein
MFSRAGYDENKWELLVEYKSTTEVRGYAGVGPEIAEQVLTAKSIGSAFNQLIKGRYEHTIYGADPKTAVPAETKPVAEGEMTSEDIDSVLGTNVAGSAEVVPAVESKPGPASPFPEMDAATAIAVPTAKAPEIESIVEQGRRHAEEARLVVVKDAITYASAALTLKILLDARTRAFNYLDPLRRAVYNAYQVVLQKQKEALDPIDAALANVKRAMLIWTDEQERERQARIAEANRAAEEEARRLQKEQSEQLTLAEVSDALEAGDTELADQLIANPLEVPLPYVPPQVVDDSVPDVEGLSRRKNWQVQKDNFDLEKFLTAVKNGTLPIPRAAKLISPNFPALNKLAKSFENAFDIPGFRAHDPGVMATRRK